LKRWHKIVIPVVAVLAITVGYIRIAAPEVLGIGYPPGVSKPSLNERIKLCLLQVTLDFFPKPFVGTQTNNIHDLFFSVDKIRHPVTCAAVRETVCPYALQVSNFALAQGLLAYLPQTFPKFPDQMLVF